jgi:hypothetical protein
LSRRAAALASAATELGAMTPIYPDLAEDGRSDGSAETALDR